LADDNDIGNAVRVNRAEVDAIVAEALVVVDQVQSLEPYLPQLAPSDRERVDDYVGRASADATLRAYKSDWRQLHRAPAGGRLCRLRQALQHQPRHHSAG
jgi:hypothetical protein